MNRGMYRTIPVLLALSAALLAGCEKREDLQVSVHSRPWQLRTTKGTILETEHYRIHTTISDSMFKGLAPVLAEHCHERFQQQLPLTGDANKMDVYIFSNRSQWEAFTKAFMGKKAASYLNIREGGYTAKDTAVLYYIGRYPTLTILAHELFHQYLQHNHAGRIPAWLNEGLACYYEAHQWRDHQPVFTPDKNLFRLKPLRKAVIGGELFSLDELLAQHVGKVMELSEDKVAAYYAQVWAMIQFLRHGQDGQYAPALQKLIADLGSDAIEMKARAYIITARGQNGRGLDFGEAVLSAYVTEDFDVFERQYNQFLQQYVQPKRAGLFDFLGLGK